MSRGSADSADNEPLFEIRVKMLAGYPEIFSAAGIETSETGASDTSEESLKVDCQVGERNQKIKFQFQWPEERLLPSIYVIDLSAVFREAAKPPEEQRTERSSTVWNNMEDPQDAEVEAARTERAFTVYGDASRFENNVMEIVFTILGEISQDLEDSVNERRKPTVLLIHPTADLLKQLESNNDDMDKIIERCIQTVRQQEQINLVVKSPATLNDQTRSELLQSLVETSMPIIEQRQSGISASAPASSSTKEPARPAASRSAPAAVPPHTRPKGGLLSGLFGGKSKKDSSADSKSSSSKSETDSTTNSDSKPKGP